MSTDPHRLKIRVRLSAPSSASAALVSASAAPVSRAALVVGAVVFVVLCAGGLWTLLTQYEDESTQPVIAAASESSGESLVESSDVASSALTPLETTPSPTAQNIPATTPGHDPGKSPAQFTGSANRVVRAVLAAGMRNHLPIKEQGNEVPASDVTQRLYFFTEVHEVSSRRFSHRWEYRGKSVAQINFKPVGKNWKSASSKQIPSHMQGKWRVVLVDDAARDLASVEFIYGAIASAAN